RRRQLGPRPQSRVECDQRRALAQSAVRPSLVVVRAKHIELQLQVRQRLRPGLLGQESFEGLVKALHLAAGLWVIGRRVDAADAQALQLQLQQHLAAARCAAEDGAVVAEETGWQAPALAGLKE